MVSCMGLKFLFVLFHSFVIDKFIFKKMLRILLTIGKLVLVNYLTNKEEMPTM